MRAVRFMILMILLLMPILIAPHAGAAQGNRAAAHACQNGGWQGLEGANGEVFENQGACVRYAAQGGVLLAPVPHSFYVDMGDPSSEAPFDLQGWGSAEAAPENPYTSPSSDKSKRFQLLNADNSITFTPVRPGASYQLTAEIEDGGCTDSFQILADNVVLYTYTTDGGLTAEVLVHTVVIPAETVTTDSLVITFRNMSTDACGRAAVFNVQIVRL